VGAPLKLKPNITRWIREYAYLHVMVVAYVAVFCTVSLVRYYAFESSAWDLGIFNQACFSTLRGKLFYYTAELYANPDGSIFGVHFSPVLFLVLPFYAVFPRPETLLVTQTVCLAVGVYPVFFLSNTVLRHRRAATLFSLLYVSYPHLHSVNLFDFHPDAFFVPFTLFALYYFTKREWGKYFGFTLLAFSTKEFTALTFLVFALADLLLMRKAVLKTLKSGKLSDERVLVDFVTVTTAIAWYFMARTVIHLFNPSPPSGFVQGSPWRILGGNPLDPSTWVNVTQMNFLGALKFEFPTKLLYLVSILAPFAFLPLLRVFRFAPVVLWLALGFLSNYPPYYELGWHYSALVVPFSILAAIEGLRRFGLTFKLDEASLYRVWKKLVVASLLSTLALTFIVVPLTQIRLSLITEHDRELQGVLEWMEDLSPNASVLTQYDVFPQVSSRLNSYVIPPPFAAFKRGYYFDYVKSLFNDKIDYVVLDVNPDVRTKAHRSTHYVALKFIEESGNYGLYASLDGILVYKYNYHGAPVKFEPFVIREEIDETIDYDTTLFAYSLPTGEYLVKCRVKIDPKISGRVFTFEVRQGNDLLELTNVDGDCFLRGNAYQNFTATVRIFDQTRETKFLMVNPSTSTEIHVDFMEITLISHSQKGET